VSFPERPSLV
jgi:large subunit ribosomal protein LP2